MVVSHGKERSKRHVSLSILDPFPKEKLELAKKASLTSWIPFQKAEALYGMLPYLQEPELEAYLAERTSVKGCWVSLWIRYHQQARGAEFISLRLVTPSLSSDIQTTPHFTRLKSDAFSIVPLHKKFLLILSILFATHLGSLKKKRKWSGIVENKEFRRVYDLPKRVIYPIIFQLFHGLYEWVPVPFLRISSIIGIPSYLNGNSSTGHLIHSLL